MLTRVHHIALNVRDLEAALGFYSGTLGLRASAPVSGAGFRSSTVNCGKSQVLLITPDGPGSLADEVERYGEGVRHVAFESDAPGLAAYDPETLPALLPREEHLGLGVALVAPEPPPAEQPGSAVTNIDHIVIASNDSGATAAHFEHKLGLEIKRKMIRPGTSAQLAFGKLVDVVIEFAGPPEPRPGPLAAKFWGLVFAVADIDAVVAIVRAAGHPVSDPIPAVQPGAKIATVKSGTGGVPFAMIQYNALPVAAG